LDASEFLAVELIGHADGTATPGVVARPTLMALLGRRRRHIHAAATRPVSAKLGSSPLE